MIGLVSSEEAARLMRAVAAKNQFRRGKKNRMECYKDFFGVYVKYSYKMPTASLRGRNWRMEFEVTHGRTDRDGYPIAGLNSVSFPQPHSPTDYQWVGRGNNRKWVARHPRIIGQAMLTLRNLEGEKFFLKDWMLLRMFESEWENTPAPEGVMSNYGDD